MLSRVHAFALAILVLPVFSCPSEPKPASSWSMRDWVTAASATLSFGSGLFAVWNKESKQDHLRESREAMAMKRFLRDVLRYAAPDAQRVDLAVARECLRLSLLEKPTDGQDLDANMKRLGGPQRLIKHLPQDIRRQLSSFHDNDVLSKDLWDILPQPVQNLSDTMYKDQAVDPYLISQMRKGAAFNLVREIKHAGIEPLGSLNESSKFDHVSINTNTVRKAGDFLDIFKASGESEVQRTSLHAQFTQLSKEEKNKPSQLEAFDKQQQIYATRITRGWSISLLSGALAAWSGNFFRNSPSVSRT